MARGSRRGDSAAEPEAFHELGVRGRKTGAFLPDHGERDEHGMQPLASIFSSPHKAPGSAEREDDSGSEDMDIASSAGPGPRTVLQNQRNIQYPIPRSRSPLKTHLKSPARKNPHLQRPSSISQSSIIQEEGEEDRGASTMPKLDFARKANGSRAAAQGKAKMVNGSRRVQPIASRDDEDEDEDEPYIHTDALQDEGMELIDGLDAAEDEDDEPLVRKPASAAKRSAASRSKVRIPSSPPVEAEEEAPSPEEADEPQPAVSAKRKRGRPPKTSPEQLRAPVRLAKQRPVQPVRVSQRSKAAPEPEPEPEPEEEEEEEPEDPEEPEEEQEQEREQEEEEEEEEEEQDPEEDARPAQKPRLEPPAAKKPGRGRPSRAPAAAPKPREVPKPKNQAKKTTKQPIEEPEAGEESFMALKRGPPMPKRRGLVSVRNPDEMHQTRSGRHSYRPVDWWRGEEIVRDDEEQHDQYHRDDFLLPSIKEILRVAPEEPAAGAKRGPRGASRRGGRPKPKSRQQQLRAAADEAADEPEAWELNPGTVTGEVVVWEPEHEVNPPADDEAVQITEDQIALSADAVQTTDIREATFRFAKTLTMPFMGAGVVDLPPGAEKRPKNSRKMHLVFFVHYGKVLVTVNEAQFRISAGGMWFVPRGNYYSISNDYDNPCRIFFSQACEVPSNTSEAIGDATSMMAG